MLVLDSRPSPHLDRDTISDFRLLNHAKTMGFWSETRSKIGPLFQDMSSEYTGIIGVGTADDGNAQFEARCTWWGRRLADWHNF